MKLTGEDELVETSEEREDLTIITAGEVMVFSDLNRSFLDVRQTEPMLLSKIPDLREEADALGQQRDSQAA